MIDDPKRIKMISFRMNSLRNKFNGKLNIYSSDKLINLLKQFKTTDVNDEYIGLG